LLDGKTLGTRKSLFWGLVCAWSLAVVALAGPSWIKRPLPVEKSQSALVVILDLSQSMLSEDVKPSRLARAKLKITDMLRLRKDGQTALVVYAGDAHTVTPLSDDSATINSLLQTLSPNIMPVPGSNTEAAIARGLELLRDAGAGGGDLLLVTDGVVPEAFDPIRKLVAGSRVAVSILGVGGHEPAPIPNSSGGFVRDQQGGIITTKLNTDELASLAQSLGGRYQNMANTDRDIENLLPNAQQGEKDKPKLERDFDQWFDQGHWLALLVLPFVLVAFRRGLMLTLLCALSFGFSAAPQTAYAWSLQESLNQAWLTKDQQAARQLQAGDAKAAADTFQSPDWKAAAQYRAGDYEAAANSYAQRDTADAHYNRGNALAKAGKLQDAIKAYDEALKRNPELADAQKNRGLVDKLLKQQPNQNQQDKNNQDKNKQDKQDNNQQNKDQQNKDQKNQGQQNQDQQQKDQQQQDQQKQEQQNKDQNQQQNSSVSRSESDSQQQSGQQSSAGSSAGQQAQQHSSVQQSSASAQQAAQQQAQSSAAGEDKDKPAQQAAKESDLTPEQQQALEQWLRRVPDDPGGLLRNKFKWQYIENRQKQMDGNYQSPDNKADQRW
jgi:Ca-activated chloride channel family protein